VEMMVAVLVLLTGYHIVLDRDRTTCSKLRKCIVRFNGALRVGQEET